LEGADSREQGKILQLKLNLHFSSVQAASASKFLTVLTISVGYVHWQNTDEDGAAWTDLW
jgi:hypothetical protein